METKGRPLSPFFMYPHFILLPHFFLSISISSSSPFFRSFFLLYFLFLPFFLSLSFFLYLSFFPSNLFFFFFLSLPPISFLFSLPPCLLFFYLSLYLFSSLPLLFISSAPGTRKMIVKGQPDILFFCTKIKRKKKLLQFSDGNKTMQK